MILQGRRSARWMAWAITLFFLAVYASISLYNHYAFRTFAYDLGIKNQAIWDYAHLRYNFNTVLPELDGRINILANHFEPILFLFGPLYYIFGSYTLLVVQMLFILLGGWGIRGYFNASGKSDQLALLAMATFYATWGVYSALSYDFHTNVLGAMLLPWVFCFMQRGKWIAALLVAFLMMNCKENMALWSVFIGLGMALHFRQSRLRWMASLGVSALGLGYFLLVMKVLMPWYAAGQLQYMHFNYAALGGDMGEALQTLITRPVYALRLLFVNHIDGDPVYLDPIKPQLHEFVMLSGGLFLLVRPQFLIMLLPVYAQKMYSDDPLKWGIFNQYSIEFVPVLVLASFSVIGSVNNRHIQLLAGLLVFLSTFDTTKALVDQWQPNAYYKTINQFYKPSHYRREIPIGAVRRALQHYVPDGASVSATYYLLPHLAARRQVYQYPAGLDADYVAWCDDGLGYFPIDSLAYRKPLDSLMTSGQWESLYADDHLQILHRHVPGE